MSLVLISSIPPSLTRVSCLRASDVERGRLTISEHMDLPIPASGADQRRPNLTCPGNHSCTLLPTSPSTREQLHSVLLALWRFINSELSSPGRGTYPEINLLMAASSINSPQLIAAGLPVRCRHSGRDAWQSLLYVSRQSRFDGIPSLRRASHRVKPQLGLQCSVGLRSACFGVKKRQLTSDSSPYSTNYISIASLGGLKIPRCRIPLSGPFRYLSTLSGLMHRARSANDGA